VVEVGRVQEERLWLTCPALCQCRGEGGKGVRNEAVAMHRVGQNDMYLVYAVRSRSLQKLINLLLARKRNFLLSLAALSELNSK
jgi:hypothetical protein